MSETAQGAIFEGWGVLELMGHQRETGYVTTQYFGGACLFRVEVPELPEREWELTAPEWDGSKYLPVGSTVKRAAVPGRTRFIAPGALYAMNPCDEAAARKAIDASTTRKVMLIRLADGVQLPPVSEEHDEQEEREADNRDSAYDDQLR